MTQLFVYFIHTTLTYLYTTVQHLHYGFLPNPISTEFVVGLIDKNLKIYIPNFHDVKSIYAAKQN